MPKPQAIARNADRNPNLDKPKGGAMKKPKAPSMSMASSHPTNSIRDRNIKRMGGINTMKKV